MSDQPIAELGDQNYAIPTAHPAGFRAEPIVLTDGLNYCTVYHIGGNGVENIVKWLNSGLQSKRSH